MTPMKRQKTRNKTFHLRFPLQSENLLREGLEAGSRAYSKSIKTLMEKYLSRLTGTRTDSIEDDIYESLTQKENEVDSHFEEKVYSLAIVALISKSFDKIVANNISEMERILSSYGVENYPISILNYDMLREQFYNEVRLRMKRNTKAFVEKVLGAFLIYQSGQMTANALKKRIGELLRSLIKSRTLAVSRDVVGAFNAKVWREIYQQLGMDKYVWDTALDECVRGNPDGKYPKANPSHWIMEGKVCSWSNESIVFEGGKRKPRRGRMPIAHPSEPWGCRCTPSPYMADVLAEIDKGL